MTIANRQGTKRSSGRDGAPSWDELRRQLEERRTRISTEISEYPSPIAGCDAHVNQLLAERERVSEELNRLEEAARRGGTVEEFVRSAAFLS